jgi:competence protein ComEC
VTAPDEPVDVRLVPAAVAVWGAAALVVPWPARALLIAGALLGLLAVAVAASSWARERGPAPDGSSSAADTTRRSGWGQATLVLGAVTVLLLVTAGQARARAAGDLRGLADDGARVRLVGVVRSTPQALPGGGGGAGVRFLLAARTVELDGAPTGTGAAVDVLAPASAAHLAYGTTVEVDARLSPVPDAARRAVARARASEEPQVRAPPPLGLRAADGLRTGLVATSAQVPGDAGRLLPAVAVGDTRGVGDLDDAMRVSGLAHLTAVSGAHFSLLGAVVLATAARCRVPRRWRWLPVSAVMAAFVLVVQPGSSVVRAAVMGAVGVLGIVAGRPARSVPALACAVLLLVLVDPWLARDIGFVLSVVATAGIALLAGPLARRWSARTRTGPGADRGAGGADRGGGGPGASAAPAAGPVATALAVPVAAQAVCAPVILVLSPAVPTYAVLANVVAAPAVGPATIGGLVAAVLGLVWPAGAAWCAQLAGAACWWIATVARTAAGLPGAQVAWAGGVLGQVLLGCACAAAVVLVLRCRRGVAP